MCVRRNKCKSLKIGKYHGFLIDQKYQKGLKISIEGLIDQKYQKGPKVEYQGF
jgi:hypothetical protein